MENKNEKTLIEKLFGNECRVLAVMVIIFMVFSWATKAHSSEVVNQHITYNEFKQLQKEVFRVLIPDEPISCSNGGKIKISKEEYAKLKNRLFQLEADMMTPNAKEYAKMGLLYRALTLDEFNSYTINTKGKTTLCVPTKKELKR